MLSPILDWMSMPGQGLRLQSEDSHFENLVIEDSHPGNVFTQTSTTTRPIRLVHGENTRESKNI